MNVYDSYADVLRRNGYQVIAPNERATLHASRHAPPTSRPTIEKIQNSSLQARMLRRFDDNTWSAGYTDDELEQYLGASHQSASACRNTLMRKGLVYDSGKTRLTRSGNDAVVWVRSDKAAVYKA